MAEVQDAAAAPAKEATPAAEKVNGDSANADGTAKTNGTSVEDTNDIDKAGAQATTEVNAPDGKGTAEADVAGAADAASSTPAGNKNKRKSTGGVPEHKNKKLNKKKSMPTLNVDLKPGDFVWARLKGYPPWPAICCDESMLPETLLGTRPVSTAYSDGTYRADFADGGKNVKDRTYPVMFFSTNEFAWMVNTALTRLEASECENAENKKLSVALKAAYKIAAENHDLAYFKDLLKKHDEELKELERADLEKAERKATEEAQKAERKAEKERRKSKAADDMDVDGESKPTKKRKKEAESEGEGPKAKKTPKVKLTAKKESQPESAKKSKPKKKAVKDEEAVPELSEEDRLKRREEHIRYIRHRLQRCFLTADVEPTESAMPAMAELFTRLEQHKDLEAMIIRKTKIHKVLKNIVRLEKIPRDDEFHFKTRSTDLLTHWSNALSAKSDGDVSTADANANTNGEPKSDDAKGIDDTEIGNGTGDEAGDAPMTDAGDAEAKESAEADKTADEGQKEGAAEKEGDE